MRNWTPDGVAVLGASVPTSLLHVGTAGRGRRRPPRVITVPRAEGASDGMPPRVSGVAQACSAAFSTTPSPERESTSTRPFERLRRKSRFGTPESSTALTTRWRSPFGAEQHATLVPAVT